MGIGTARPATGTRRWWVAAAWVVLATAGFAVSVGNLIGRPACPSGKVRLLDTAVLAPWLFAFLVGTGGGWLVVARRKPAANLVLPILGLAFTALAGAGLAFVVAMDISPHNSPGSCFSF